MNEEKQQIKLEVDQKLNFTIKVEDTCVSKKNALHEECASVNEKISRDEFKVIIKEEPVENSDEAETSVHENIRFEPTKRLFKIIETESKIKKLESKLNKLYICEICNTSFNKAEIVQHLLVHYGKKSYSCNECNKSYTRNDSLVMHKRSHTGEKPFSCDICNKMFSRTHTLKRHRNTHFNLKPFSCTQCVNQYGTSDELKRHKIAHMVFKRFSCTECSKSYGRISNLNRHKKIHLNNF